MTDTPKRPPGRPPVAEKKPRTERNARYQAKVRERLIRLEDLERQMADKRCGRVVPESLD